MEHRAGNYRGFTRIYWCKKLIYYETTKYILNAIAREKELKKWSRKKKVDLINKANPEWKDLTIGWDLKDGDSSLRSE